MVSSCPPSSNIISSHFSTQLQGDKLQDLFQMLWWSHPIVWWKLVRAKTKFKWKYFFVKTMLKIGQLQKASKRKLNPIRPEGARIHFILRLLFLTSESEKSGWFETLIRFLVGFKSVFFSLCRQGVLLQDESESATKPKQYVYLK